MSSSRPFSQIRSSVKSLLMTAVVVVFNWKRKYRATSGAKHPFWMRKPFLPWPITVTHSGAGTALLENRRLRSRQEGVRRCGRQAQAGSAPSLVSLYRLRPTLHLPQQSHWAGYESDGTEPERRPGGACEMSIPNSGAWNRHSSWIGDLLLSIDKQNFSKLLFWFLLPIHTNLVLVQSDTQRRVDGQDQFLISLSPWNRQGKAS